WAASVLSAAALCAIGGALLWNRSSSPSQPAASARAPEASPEPPTVESPDLDPAIKRVLEEARRAVLKSPESAAAWGQLGLVLTAHSFHVPARVCFARAEELDPQEPRWPYFQGKSLLV